MSVAILSVTITTAGTIQKLSQATTPTLPTVSMGGVTSASGSATQQCRQVIIQANPGNTGNVFIGNAGFASSSGACISLAPGAFSPPIGGGDLAPFALDDLWGDTATSGNKITVVAVVN